MITLKSDETTNYGFQHPDNGCPMTLQVGADGNAEVTVDDWATDDATPADRATWEAQARELTRAVRRETDLYEAACKLHRLGCRDILG